MSDFFKILFIAELKTLSGSSMRTIGALVSILLFTILALGLAYGTLGNLKERMDNPYTNWVDVPVTISIESKVDNILNYFKLKENLEQFNLADVTRYDVYFAQFLHAEQKDTLYIRGRTVEGDEKILQSILKDIKGNVLVQNTSFEDSPCGIVVTQKFLQTLGYRDNLNGILKVSMPYKNNRVFIDIIAVVKELPSLCDFMSGPILPNMRNLSNLETGFIDESISNIVQVVIGRKLTNSEIRELENEFREFNIIRITERESIEVNKGQEHIIYQFAFPVDQILDSKIISEKIEQNKIGVAAFIYKETKCNGNFRNIESPDNFAFEFNDLEKIRSFKEGMQEMFGINVSMQQIESAENFSLVSTLTFTTSLVLFGFALLSIGFYISSLIRSHLQKISANLGTMKAFGLRNIVLIRVYIAIIGVFCTLSSVISLVVAIAIQFVARKTHIKFDLDVLNMRVILALVVIVLLCLYLAYRSTRVILNNTPGDLIYKRNN